MNILITGGAGYLGSVITPLLVNKGYDVTVYDNLMYNQLTLSDLCYKSNFKFVYGDVRDYKKLNEYVQKADVIIPLAAIVGFPACEKDKQLAEEVNYNQIYDLITNTSKEQTIIFPNTNSGYGTRSSGICKENQKLQPLSHYGITKCNAECPFFENGIFQSVATPKPICLSKRIHLKSSFFLLNYSARFPNSHFPNIKIFITL